MEFKVSSKPNGIHDTGESLSDGTQCQSASIDVLSPKSVHITIEGKNTIRVKRSSWALLVALLPI